MTPGDHPKLEGIDREETLSMLFHSLRASRRRCVIALLDDEQAADAISTRRLARQIAGRENGQDPSQVNSIRYKNVYNALSQSHLPTLTEARIIVYDPQRQMIHRGPLFTLALLLLNLNQPTVAAFYEHYSETDAS